MARHHRRPKQDVRLAVTESATRVRADIEALSDKLDQQARVSRRYFVVSSAVTVAGGIIGLTTVNQSQPARDVTFSVVSDHGIRAGGTPQVARHHHVNAGPVTIRVDVPEPSVTVRRGAAVLRV